MIVDKPRNSPNDTKGPRGIAPRLYAAVLLLISFPLIGRGGCLLRIGGLPYHPLAGLCTLVSAVGIAALCIEGAYAYARLLLLTMPRAIREVGLNGWALLPRLFAPAVLGLPLLLPAVRRQLTSAAHRTRPASGWPVTVMTVTGTVAICALSLVLRPADPVDPMYQMGIFAGTLPQVGKTPAVNGDGDWLHYGRDAGRKRFSPLDEVTPANGALNAPQIDTPYVAIIKVFLSPLGLPCNQPPFGMLAAVDIASGKPIWAQSFGSTRESGPLGTRAKPPFTIGTPNGGSTLAMASGLLFTGATQDGDFRTFDARTGRTRWRADLGAGGQATPMTYIAPGSGRQVVVVAARGNPIPGSVLGDYIVA